MTDVCRLRWLLVQHPEALDLTPSISDEALETFWSIIDNTDAKVILGPVVKTRPELALFLG